MTPHIVTYQPKHFHGVAALWREVFPDDRPWNVAEVAIPEKLKAQPDLLLVALINDEVVGSIMAGYDGHRGWISRIAVTPSCRHAGVGSALIKEAERRLVALGCIKVNLQIVASNAGVVRFYESLGYAIEERISMSKQMS